jgi:hypothetical protein
MMRPSLVWGERLHEALPTLREEGSNKKQKIITHAAFDILVNNFGIEDMLTLLSLDN